jgi:broad specificity phosphatase PhoE
MQLYFIRHGQSANNFLWDQTQSNKGRSEDPPLTDIGRQQATLVARLAGECADSMRDIPSLNTPTQNHGFGLTHVYCSLMLRAVDTGYAVAQACQLPLIAWIDLHEHGGIYLEDEQDVPHGLPGKGRRYFAERYPNLILPETLDENGWWNRRYEFPEERRPRAQRVAQTLLERHGQTADRVAVITHGAFYNQLMSVILKTPPPDESRQWFVLNNCAVTRLDFVDNELGIVYTNRIDFLPRELIT